MKPFSIFQIIEICLIYIMYDPNYNYDDDMNDFSDDGVMDIEEDAEEDAEDEYSDDDDMSWKVRRAAAKCLEAAVSTRRELLSDFYKGVSPALIARFKGEYHVYFQDLFTI
jgi:cullin-associated NEDD8-dissociated protein 1